MATDELPRTPSALVSEAVASVAREQSDSRVVRGEGFTTGFQELDQVLGGVRPGALYLVGGRPGMGKTAFALHLCAQFLSGAPAGAVLFECLDKSAVTTARFAMERNAGTVFPFAAENREAWSRLTEAASALARSNLWFDDRPLASPSEFEARVGAFADHMGADAKSIGLVVIDPIEVLLGLHPPSTRARSRVLTMLRRIAETHSVPVVATVGVRRSVELRDWHEPGLKDVVGGAALAQFADAIVLLYRPAYYDRSAPREECRLIVARNRFGRERELTVAYGEDSVSFGEPPDPYEGIG